MVPGPETSFRPWVRYMVVCVWATTALAVVIATHVHPATTANATVNTRKISFATNASHILSQSDEDQLLVSGVRSLQIRFNESTIIQSRGKSSHTNLLAARGDSFTSCSFYLVRSGGLEVRGPAVLTLETINPTKSKSFTLRSHGSLNDNLSSLGNQHDAHGGFECRGLHISNDGPATDVDGDFSNAGGDSIFLATTEDSRLDFWLAQNPEIGDTQIPILSEIRFSEIDPTTSDEKSVLLQPPPEISFEIANKKVTTNRSLLLVIIPQAAF